MLEADATIVALREVLNNLLFEQPTRKDATVKAALVNDSTAPAAEEARDRIKAEAISEFIAQHPAEYYVPTVIAKWLASPETARLMAEALRAAGYVQGVADRYGRFNDVYWERSARALLQALRDRP